MQSFGYKRFGEYHSPLLGPSKLDEKRPRPSRGRIQSRVLPERTCLCCYVPTVITEAVFHFPELLLFVFLCGGITVWEKKKRGGNNTTLGVPDHPSSI